MIENDNTPQWMISGRDRILESMGYDLNSEVSVYEQFLQRHYEALVLNPAPKELPKQYKNKPGPRKGSKFINGKYIRPESDEAQGALSNAQDALS
jgi:hypothetical protein